MKKFVYCDHAAATPLDIKVFEAMRPYFFEKYGNPSSIYTFAQEARKAVDTAREKVAGILECGPREVIFTAGGTESNNALIFGAARGALEKRVPGHIITTKIEHESVFKPLEYCESQGWQITYLDVGEYGIVEPHDVVSALRPETILVTIMYANNEIGTIQPIAEISKALNEWAAAKPGRVRPVFHTDACQAAPYLSVSIPHLGVDAMTLNSGKIYGPKGAGALFVREGVTLKPLILGGGQEHRMRSGTENVPAIVGFAEALSLVQRAREAETVRLLPLREALIDGILSRISNSRLNGDRQRRLPNNVNVSFRGLEGEPILIRLDMAGIAASAGSACSSGSLEPSHVLRALGLSEEWSHSATRFTLGHGSTKEDVDFVLQTLPNIVAELREASPF